MSSGNTVRVRLDGVLNLLLAPEYGGVVLYHGEAVEAKGGYDVGTMNIEGKKKWEMAYVNEYMTLESGDRRVATYPDLMTTFDADGVPVTSTSLKRGDIVYVVTAPKENLKVGDERLR